MIVLALLAAVSAASPTQTPALPDALRSALAACLGGERWQVGPDHLAASVADAPGLPPGSVIASVPTASGRLFAYQDGGGSVIDCGVAVYGDASAIELSEVRQQIERSDPRLQPASPDAWRLSNLPGARTFYWGVANAPSLAGVALRYAAPGPTGPSLQVDKHSVLVR